MRGVFYPKLAWTGIQKNKQLYIPYILTCAGMVMMHYILGFLVYSNILKGTPGGATVQGMLGLGIGVISVFAFIFLFYTNSFLVRRRKKEFGLYNILGMGKWNLIHVLIWESLIIAAISLLGGLFTGILLSKFAELGMINILHADATFRLTIETKAIIETLKTFAVIFVLILLNMLWQIRISNPIELLRSENTGEKPPKANWLLALVGVVMLGGTYYYAVTLEEPLSAMVSFPGLAIVVIIATYLLFIAGSIAVCRALQKKKRFYYKTNHFVSVASMVYRMKRNGAGLASICILGTMVLVMLASTMSLYIGTEDNLRTRYPRNINLDASMESAEALEHSAYMDEVRTTVEQTVSDIVPSKESVIKNVMDYRLADFAGYVEDGRIYTEPEYSKGFGAGSYSEMWQIFVVPLEDYNRLMDQNEQLESGEVMIYTTKQEYEDFSISIGDNRPFKVKKAVSDFVDNGVDAMQIIPSMFLFVPDLESFVQPIAGQITENGNPVLGVHWLYGFDLDCENEKQIQIQNCLEEKLDAIGLAEAENGSSFTTSCEGAARERADFYGLYGGLFFLGILLGVVFLFAAVLIIYYKQISEGYEDQSRFGIMQKVGMTKTDIKKSINSQVLMVFFLPLLMAGVHLSFAFPMICRMLVLFGLSNLKLLIEVTVGCYLVFAVFYVCVYKITSRAYYRIVSGEKN